jgi:hypothetical protein
VSLSSSRYVLTGLYLGSNSSIIGPGGGKIGLLREKGDNWAVCTLDSQSNTLNNGLVNPETREELQGSPAILLYTVTGAVRGRIVGCSLLLLLELRNFLECGW